MPKIGQKTKKDPKTLFARELLLHSWQDRCRLQQMACTDTSRFGGFLHLDGCEVSISRPESNQEHFHLPPPKQYRDRSGENSKYKSTKGVLVRGRSASPERVQFKWDSSSKTTMMRSRSMPSLHLNRSLHNRNIGHTILSTASESLHHGEGIKMAKAHAAECNIVLDKLLRSL